MLPAEFKRVREDLYGQTQAQWAVTIGLDGVWRERTVRKYEGGKVPIAGSLRRVVEMLRDAKEPKRPRPL